MPAWRATATVSLLLGFIATLSASSITKIQSRIGRSRAAQSPTGLMRTRSRTPYSSRLGRWSKAVVESPHERCEMSSAIAPEQPTPEMSKSVLEVPKSSSRQGEGKLGVLMLNLGGPETLEDVEPFLYNLFADPDIIRLPPILKGLQPVLAKFLSSSRAPKSKEAYSSIGGGSPLRKITEEQAAALEDALRERGQDAKVYVGMRYWKPFTEDSLEQIKRDGIKQLVVLPLYPQFSISTSGSSLRLLAEIFKNDDSLKDLQHTVIPSWYQRPGYVRAMGDLIEKELEKFGDRSGKAEIFFSAHGVPKSYVEEAFDPYQDEMEHCVQLIMKELRNRGVKNHHTLAYQSRVGPVEWLQPYTEDAIQELASEGVDDLLVVPISFVNEHIETLEEIDMEYREVAEEAGISNWGRVPALNSYPGFIEDLASAVLEAKPYIGSIGAVSNAESLVPGGDVNELMTMYDNSVEKPTVIWEPRWGWNKDAETINGRIAMLALLILALLQ